MDLQSAWQILSKTCTPGFAVAPALSDGNLLNFKVENTNTAKIPSDIALLQTLLVVMGAVSYANHDLGSEWLREFPLAVSHVLGLHGLPIATEYAQTVLDVLLQGLRGPGPLPRASLDLALMTSLVTFHEVQTTSAAPPRIAGKNKDCIKWMKGFSCHLMPCPFLHDPAKRDTIPTRATRGGPPDRDRNRKKARVETAPKPRPTDAAP